MIPFTLDDVLKKMPPYEGLAERWAYLQGACDGFYLRGKQHHSDAHTYWPCAYSKGYWNGEAAR